MSSKLQLDVSHHNEWVKRPTFGDHFMGHMTTMHRLVNAYKVEAGMMYFLAGKIV